MCITDPEWVEILERSRIGECSEDDRKEMKKLVLTNTDCEVPDFTSMPWSEAILVMPRPVTPQHPNLLEHSIVAEALCIDRKHPLFM